jgi:tetratricopeptide (TPR) repeat protein
MTGLGIRSRPARRRVVVALLLAAFVVLAGVGGSPAALAQELSSASEPVRQALAAALQALEIDDYAAAEKGFTRATELDASLVPGWLGLAEARLRLGRAQDALDAARQAQKVAPELGAAAFAVARCLAELGSYREALAALERVRELEPDTPDALVLSALVLRELDRADEARALLDQAWRGGVRDERLAEQLAVLRLGAGDAAGAAEVAEQALADGESANLKLVLAFALAKDPARREEAARRFEEALAAGVPQPGPVRLELGGILLDGGRAADALPHLEEAARLLPELSAAHYKLAQARRATGDAAGAEQALARFQELDSREQATARDSKELGIALNEAQNLASENRLTESLARLDALHAAHPDDPRVNAQRAKVLYSMGRRREAEASIAAASARSPGRAEYRYLEGLFHMYAGRLAAAETALREALQIDGGLAEAHALLAGALAKQRKPEEAIVHFQRAIELGADAPEVRLGYAGALETLGREAEAKEQMDAYRRLAAGPPPP